MKPIYRVDNDHVCSVECKLSTVVPVELIVPIEPVVPEELKAVFHFNRIVAERSVFYCVHIISSAWVFTKQWNTLRFATIRLKWKTGFMEPIVAEEPIEPLVPEEPIVPYYTQYLYNTCKYIVTIWGDATWYHSLMVISLCYHWSKLLDKASFWIQWPNFEARIFIVKWYTKIDQNYCKSNRNV